MDDGHTWKTKNGYLGEPCLRFPISTINTILWKSGLGGEKLINNIALTDMLMSPGPNKCGGDYNTPELQQKTTNLLIAFIKQCPNLKTIVVFVSKPNAWAIDKLLPRLKEENLDHLFDESLRKGSDTFLSPHRFICHPQFYLMGCNTNEDNKDLMRVVASVYKAKHSNKDILSLLLGIDDKTMMELVLFITEGIKEARRQVLSQLMIDKWADPEGPFAHLSQLMIDKWADGKYDHLSQLMIDKWADEKYDHLSQLMIDKWANGKYDHLSQLMIDIWADPEGPFAHFKTRNYKDCMYCKTSFCVTRIRLHEESCPSNLEGMNLSLRQQQERLLKYTPSENDAVLQTDSQRCKKESYPPLKGNDRLEDSIRTHSASFKTARPRSQGRTAILDKIMKTIERRDGYFVRYKYFNSKVVKYKPMSKAAPIRKAISTMLMDHHIV
jgi:hypothetical protein